MDYPPIYNKENIKKIDTKYLSDNIATKEYVNEEIDNFEINNNNILVFDSVYHLTTSEEFQQTSITYDDALNYYNNGIFLICVFKTLGDSTKSYYFLKSYIDGAFTFRKLDNT